MGKRRMTDVPVRKNEEVVIRIEDMGNSGEGIGRANGYALFVKDALPGELVKVKIMKAKKNYGYAKLVEILSPSKDRVKPECEVAGPCGGCQLPHMRYEAQLRYKEQKVVDCLKRIGGFDDVSISAAGGGEGKPEGVPVEPIIGMEDAYRYRNKAQYPVGKGKDGKPVIGFYASRSHSIVEGGDCLIQSECNSFIIEKVRGFMVEYKVEPYEEVSHSGLVRHILTRVGYRTGEVMACLVINGDRLPHGDRLVDSLLKMDGWLDSQKGKGKGVDYRMKSVCLNVNKERTNVILGERVIPLWGEAYITDYIGDLKYRISPLSFYQVNPKQTERLYDVVLQYADLTGNEVVWDLYCGIGTIGLYLAGKVKKVFGVEVVPQAVEDARENARLNGITNAEFFVGKAEEVLGEKLGEGIGGAETGDGKNVVVLDPPRKGCGEELLQTIVKMGVDRVVYVSCDPATLARDLRYLRDGGYGVERVQPVDMFPMGGHVETIVSLCRENT